ncbi:DUF2849 domain-containing protein [Denitrobaculum tricleocarpae]|nr:DUF2849 domain-containing protein [Denitrobaculum tricleocarpae]
MSVQILTANRLGDGAVVYRAKAGGWTERLSESLLLATPENAAPVLAAAETPQASLEIVGPYLMPVDTRGGQIRPVETREFIRAQGPSVQFGNGHDVENTPLSLAG